MIDPSIICPYCESTAIRSQGLTAAGTQRYHCRGCTKSFTFKPVGRRSIGDRPLTNYERVKRCLIKKKALAAAEAAEAAEA